MGPASAVFVPAACFAGATASPVRSPPPPLPGRTSTLVLGAGRDSWSLVLAVLPLEGAAPLFTTRRMDLLTASRSTPNLMHNYGGGKTTGAGTRGKTACCGGSHNRKRKIEGGRLRRRFALADTCHPIPERKPGKFDKRRKTAGGNHDGMRGKTKKHTDRQATGVPARGGYRTRQPP